MNETKLRRINNHFNNRSRDNRDSFVSTITAHICKLGEGTREANEFLLKSLPYIQKYSEEKKNRFSGSVSAARPTCNSSLSGFINDHGTVEKGKIYSQFMKTCMDAIVDDTDDNRDDESIPCCPNCHTAMVHVLSEARCVCESCGTTVPYQDFGLQLYVNTSTFNGELVTQFPYKRVNHFREWIAQVQGKENTTIPDSVIIQLMKELKKERVYDEKNITHDKIKRYLKMNGLSKYYEHIPTIISRICRRDKIDIPFETEQKLVEMFCEIQEPFERYRPKERVNFISYSYCLNKLCFLVGRPDLATMFSLLKSRTKLRVQDEIWEKICLEKGWQYVPSL